MRLFVLTCALVLPGYLVATAPQPNSENSFEDAILDIVQKQPIIETDTNAEDVDRSKKSATTTFCVEIKPNETPIQVSCDDSGSQQQLSSNNMRPTVIYPQIQQLPVLAPQEPISIAPQSNEVPTSSLNQPSINNLPSIQPVTFNIPQFARPASPSPMQLSVPQVMSTYISPPQVQPSQIMPTYMSAPQEQPTVPQAMQTFISPPQAQPSSPQVVPTFVNPPQPQQPQQAQPAPKILPTYISPPQIKSSAPQVMPTFANLPQPQQPQPQSTPQVVPTYISPPQTQPSAPQPTQAQSEAPAPNAMSSYITPSQIPTMIRRPQISYVNRRPVEIPITGFTETIPQIMNPPQIIMPTIFQPQPQIIPQYQPQGIECSCNTVDSSAQSVPIVQPNVPSSSPAGSLSQNLISNVMKDIMANRNMFSMGSGFPGLTNDENTSIKNTLWNTESINLPGMMKKMQMVPTYSFPSPTSMSAYSVPSSVQQSPISFAPTSSAMQNPAMMVRCNRETENTVEGTENSQNPSTILNMRKQKVGQFIRPNENQGLQHFLQPRRLNGYAEHLQPNHIIYTYPSYGFLTQQSGGNKVESKTQSTPLVRDPEVVDVTTEANKQKESNMPILKNSIKSSPGQLMNQLKAAAPKNIIEKPKNNSPQ